MDTSHPRWRDKPEICEATANMVSQQLGLPTLHPHDKTGPVNNQSRIESCLMGPYPPLLNYWQLTDSGGRILIVFRCVPSGAHTRLQQMVSTLWPHRLLR